MSQRLCSYLFVDLLFTLWRETGSHKGVFKTLMKLSLKLPTAQEGEEKAAVVQREAKYTCHVQSIRGLIGPISAVF